MGSISLKYKSKSGNLTAPGDVDPGAMIPIQTITVGAGGVSSVTFSNIPQNYEHLQLRFFGNSSSTGNSFAMRANGGVSTGQPNAYWHYLTGNGSSVYAGSASDNSTKLYGAYVGTTANPVAGIAEILDYTNTNKYKVAKIISGSDSNGSGETMMLSCTYASTTAVTSLYVFPTGGTFTQYSHFALYGIKRAGA